MRIILILLLALTCLVCPIGCQNTSPQRIAYNATESVVVSVDAAMKVWAGYVIQQRKLTANDPQKSADLNHRENEVRSAYQKYQTAVRAAIAAQMAYSGGVTNIPQISSDGGVQAAAIPLLSLISTLTK